MLVLWFLIISIMLLTGTAGVSFEEIGTLLLSSRGLGLLGLILILALIYPKYGYALRIIPKITRQKELTAQLESVGMVLYKTEGTKQFYHYRNLFRRIMSRMESLEVDLKEDCTEIEGSKVLVARVLYKLESIADNE